jgi:alginate O-acetyltransferase complex protein AlgI
MSFDSPIFIFFLSAFLILYYLVPTSARTSLFLVSGIIFLLAGDSRSAVIFSVFVGVSFVFAWLISASEAYRKFWFTFSIVSIFSILVVFRLLQKQEAHGFFPLGYSFYAFTCVTYLVDVYDRKLKPDFLRYSSAISFFPILVSGPITPLAKTIPQMQRPETLDWSLARQSSVRIAVGFFKKSVSEMMAASMLESLSNAQLSWGRCTWLYVIAYVAKYYADFSGYSDIAIGTAGLLGISIPNNFNLPFVATSVADFWRRWHMTLNWWANLYVFKPLVYTDAFSFLNRVPKLGAMLFAGRAYPALLLAMVVIGIWHGLTLNFLCWGLYMGVFLCLEMRFPSLPSRVGLKPVRILLTFFLLINGFVLFFSPNLKTALAMWARMYDMHAFVPSTFGYSFLIVTASVLVIPHLIDGALIHLEYLKRRPLLAAIACIILFGFHFFLDGFHGSLFEYSKF